MTPQHAKTLLPIITAFAEGKTIEVLSGPYWVVLEDADFYGSPSSYRIKPEPKLRPWRPVEVPVGALMRARGAEGYRTMILAADPTGCVYIDDNHYGVRELLITHEHSLDNGKTWQPCGVYET